MKNNPLECQQPEQRIGVFECEVHLKFHLIEEKDALSDRDSLLEQLIDAFICGADEYLEPVQVHAHVKEVAEVNASPQMRRQLIRLRNMDE